MSGFDLEAMRADAAAGTKGPWRYEPVLSFRGDEILGHAVMGANAGHELLYWDADDDPSQAADARRMGRVTDMEAEIERLRAENGALREAVGLVAENATADEIPKGYGPDMSDPSPDWHDGFDAAVRAARVALGDRP